MTRKRNAVGELVRDEKGAGLVEYVMLVTLVALAVSAGATTFGEAVKSKFSDAASAIDGL